MLRLNLGCCDRHLPGYINVDVCEPADAIVNLEHTWPWADSSVDEIVANDIFEHLPSKIHTMNEAHRVLKPGGILSLIVPTTDGRGAFQDPTHVSYWTPNDLWYYEHGNPHLERFHMHYGITARFVVHARAHDELPGKVWKLSATLEAVK